ncbi:MAG: hypothetical protein P8X57_02245, partial [Cyclobacteriaceae bacterium]
GKRMSYAHPLRIYLIISLFYFFVCSMIVQDMLKGTDETIASINENAAPLEFLDKEQREELMQNMSAKSMEGVLNDLENSDNPDFVTLSEAIRQNTSEEERQRLARILNGSIVDSLKLDLSDSLPSNRIRISPDEAPINTTISYDSSSKFLLFEKLNEIYKLSDNNRLSEDQIIDSVSTREVKGFERHATSQGIKIMRAPVFALVLKLLYVRRKFLYIHHVIHGFHLHSFAYLIYGITLIFTYFLIDNDSLSNSINFLIFIAVSTYAYFSFLRVYRQGWFKTLIKFNLVGIIYLFLIITFFLMEMTASVLSY